MPEIGYTMENANDIYILVSYLAGALVLIGLALVTWRGKKKDENDLRKLEEKIQNLSDKQSIKNG